MITIFFIMKVVVVVVVVVVVAGTDLSLMVEGTYWGVGNPSK